MNFIEGEGWLRARIFARSANIDISQFGLPGCWTVIDRGWSYQPCDVAVVYGLENPARKSAQSQLRNSVYRLHKGPVLTVESSLMGRVFQSRTPKWFAALGGWPLRPKQQHPYFRIAVGGALGDDADFNAKNSPPDRWRRMSAELGLALEPYRTDGEHILLIGQAPRDASLRGTDMCDWLVSTAKGLRLRTRRPIHVRLHPSTPWKFIAPMIAALSRLPGVRIAAMGRPIAEDLTRAWACVTHSSGVAIDALMAGIPPICVSPASLAYSLCSRSLDEIETPFMPGREQFFYDLAYSQWSEAEMEDGTAWRHIKPAVERRLAVFSTAALQARHG
jgi:hypothetical protein